MLKLANASGVPTFMYARISEDRIGGGLGEVRQLEDQCEIFERFGLRLAGVYVDNDISAYSGKRRPDYEAMLDGLRAGRARAVTAWHTDRLHRSPTELEEYIAVCDPGGVTTYTVKAGHLDLSTPSGRMVARQLGAVARFESEHKADRIKAKRLQAAKEGRWQGGPRPFGFEPDGVKHRKIEADEIAEGTKSVLAGVKVHTVVKGVNERGVRTTTGRLFSGPAFQDVLMRPRNAGLAVYQGEVIGKAEWKRIVSPAKWRAVVSILKDPARRSSPGNRVRWFGSGLYLCETCGRPSLRCSTVGKNTRSVYRCRSTNNQFSKGHVARDARMLDDFAERLIVHRLAQPDAIDLLRTRRDVVDVAELHAESIALREQMDELARAFADRKVSISQLTAGSEPMQKRLDDITADIAAASLADPLAGLVGVGNVADIWFGTKPDRSDGLDLDRRRAAFDALATVTVLKTGRGRPPKDGRLDPKTVRVEWKRDAAA
ncbi:recombinase family protein [Amycolatopsis sp. YIM 10]|uniref:recombinase family protein n=1 Tax=Amycolatopsis sp. YIM 10 TaxID=2653857 RepID=UPI001883ECFD|nr:recombinase family protein [Amycolatopsis sp. YIM 10]